MNNSHTTNKVPIGQKIAFGFGMLANQMFPAILGIFMIVLVEDLGFSGWMWSLVFLFPRIFDAFLDPIMGFISDNTKSKWGRRRQYVLIGGIIMGLAYIFMWQLYKEDGLQYNFWYFFLWSLVFYLGLTIFSVPYVAMGYEMSDDFHERTNIMAISQWIGQWAWVIAPLFWIIMYDENWFPSADVAVRELAIWVAIPCAICAIVPAIFIESKSTKNENYEPLNSANIGNSLKKIFDSFGEAFKIKEFRKLSIINAYYKFLSFLYKLPKYNALDEELKAQEAKEEHFKKKWIQNPSVQKLIELGYVINFSNKNEILEDVLQRGDTDAIVLLIKLGLSLNPYQAAKLIKDGKLNCLDAFESSIKNWRFNEINSHHWRPMFPDINIREVDKLLSSAVDLGDYKTIKFLIKLGAILPDNTVHAAIEKKNLMLLKHLKPLLDPKRTITRRYYKKTFHETPVDIADSIPWAEGVDYLISI